MPDNFRMLKKAAVLTGPAPVRPLADFFSILLDKEQAGT